MNRLYGDETSNAPGDSPSDPATASASYLVVARRYRPRAFAELIGQSHVVQGLINAIRTDRVGHAYLFTGARGVGKTSTARIFAKCLNAPEGPTPEPDDSAEVCRQIDAGEDIDVIEIDGASNRGIEEIRQLRANINVRPSRSRYKIYIIDEVHMLTTAAFNALLKTLEEPPPHVKFIFCTTDPDKIPITVRSRCQRFDFAPVAIADIVERLEQIVREEGREADTEALELLAHRAGGSVRDSQSLLEQLLAFAEGRLTVDAVHGLLGTAGDETMAELVARLAEADAAGALAIVDRSTTAGLDMGQLAEQLLQVYRDGLVAEAGGDPRLLHYAAGPVAEALGPLRSSLGLSGLSAAMQLLDHTLVRMRQSTHARALVELAVVRLCHLGALRDLPQWLTELPSAATSPPPTGPPSASSTPPRKSVGAAAVPLADTAVSAQRPSDSPVRPAEPRKVERRRDPAEAAPPTGRSVESGEEESAVSISPAEASSRRDQSEEVAASNGTSPPLGDPRALWDRAAERLEGMAGQMAADVADVDWASDGALRVRFRQRVHCRHFELSSARRELEAALAAVAGRPVVVKIELAEGTARPSVPRAVSPRQQRLQTQRSPLVQTAIDLFDADVVRIEAPADQPVSDATDETP